MVSINLRNLNSTLPDDFDVFFCSSSFESRCLSAPNKLKRKHFRRVVIVENKNGSEYIHNNTQKLLELFGQKAKVISIDYQNPLEIADAILPEIKKDSSGRKSRILVDVTTFTHELLMIFLKIAAIKKNQVAVTCIYVNAADYCSYSEVNRKWLSRGCKDVHSILGYPGLLFPSQKDRLIIIVGYEYNRAADVINALEPNGLTLVYGSPNNSTTEKNREASKLYSELVEQMAFNFDSIERAEIPCDDPDKASERLCEIYKKHFDENIIVIPMNNKLSTIGVAKSIMQTDYVQACYAPAVVYNERDYSIPGNSCYIYDF